MENMFFALYFVLEDISTGVEVRAQQAGVSSLLLLRAIWDLGSKPLPEELPSPPHFSFFANLD